MGWLIVGVRVSIAGVVGVNVTGDRHRAIDLRELVDFGVAFVCTSRGEESALTLVLQNDIDVKMMKDIIKTKASNIGFTKGTKGILVF